MRCYDDGAADDFDRSVGGEAPAALNASLAAAASPTGLLRTFSNVKRFRADMGCV